MPAKLFEGRKPPFMEEAVFSVHADVENRHWWFLARRRILLPLIDRVMAEAPGDLVVDVGCGTGGTVAALKGRHPCLGIDSSAVAIETALRLYPDCDFRRGVMPDDLADVRSRIGLYLLMDVLEHIEDDRAFLEKLLTIVEPGAGILVTVPAEPAMWSRHDDTAGHVRRYDRAGFERLFRGLPLELRLMAPFNTRLYPAVRLVRGLGNLRGLSAGAAGTDFALPPAPANRALEWIFAGERHALLRAYGGGRRRSLLPGVSLLAVLKRPARQ
jgi:SAM-dependent methyltransferase